MDCVHFMTLRLPCPVENADNREGDVPVTLADQMENQAAADTRLLDSILVCEMLAGLPFGGALQGCRIPT